MPWRIFDKPDFPIDTDIQWKITSFGLKAPPDGCVGVCHGLHVDIGDVGLNYDFLLSKSPVMISFWDGPGERWSAQ